MGRLPTYRFSVFFPVKEYVIKSKGCYVFFKGSTKKQRIPDNIDKWETFPFIMLLCVLRMNVKKFIATNLWLVFMAVMSNLLAFVVWRNYLETGLVHDRKHGFISSGEAVSGHLIWVSLMAVIFTIFLIKAVAKENSRNKKL